MRSLKDRQWQDELAENDDRDLVSRSDKRRDRVTVEDALKELALSLVGLKPKNLKRIELPDYVVESIDKARSFKSPKARNRQVLVVRQHLREIDAEAIELAVTDILFPPVRKVPVAVELQEANSQALANGAEASAVAQDVAPAPADKAGRIDAWERRLLRDGDGALAQLVAEYPHANSQGLRQQLRAVRKSLEETLPQTEVAAVTASKIAALRRSTIKLRGSLRSLVR